MNGTNTAPAPTPEILRRVLAALDSLESIEHRVSQVVEGGRQQLSHLVADLKIRELQAELRAIAKALKQ
jgi:hypothetical protein